MSPGKSDALRGRLTEAGLSPEACTKYLNVLKEFLNARLTKSKYEDEMSRVLPKDKYHVHNAIIHDILFHAQQKRKGVRDLPILVPLKEKRPPQARPVRPVSSKLPTIKTENGRLPKSGNKRPFEESELDRKRIPASSLSCSPTVVNTTVTGNANIITNENVAVSSATTPVGVSTQPPIKKHKSGRRLPEMEKPRIPKPKLEKPSPKLEKKKNLEKATSIGTPASPVGTGNNITSSMIKTPTANTGGALAVSSRMEIPTYNMLQFHPLHPGHDVDSDLYWRVRQMVRRIATEHGMIGVKDEAVMAMVEGLEIHVRNLIAAGARQRAMRNDRITKKHAICEPIDARDIREVSRWNTGLLGEDPGLELERLLMLL